MSVEQSTYLGYGFLLDEVGVKAAARTIAQWMGPDTEEEWERDAYYPTEMLESLKGFLDNKGMAGADYTFVTFGSMYDNTPVYTAVVLKKTFVRLGGDFAEKTYVAVRDDNVSGVDKENLDWVAALLLPENLPYKDYGWLVGTLWH